MYFMRVSKAALVEIDNSWILHALSIFLDEHRIVEANDVKNIAYRAPEVPPILREISSEIVNDAAARLLTLIIPLVSPEVRADAPVHKVVPQSPSPMRVSKWVISGSALERDLWTDFKMLLNRILSPIKNRKPAIFTPG